MYTSVGLLSLICSTIIFVSGFVSVKAQSQLSWYEDENQITWMSLSDGMKQAQSSDKIVLISVMAENCPYCRKMETKVYAKEEIQEGIQEYFLPVVIDVNNDEEFLFEGKPTSTNELLNNWNVMGTPTTLFVDDDLNIIAFQPGFLDAEMYNKLLHFVGSGAYATIDFSEFEMDHDH